MEEEGRVNEGEKEGRKREFGPPIFTTDQRHCLHCVGLYFFRGHSV